MRKRMDSDGDVPPDKPRMQKTDKSNDNHNKHEIHQLTNEVMMNMNQQSETSKTEENKVNKEDHYKETKKGSTKYDMKDEKERLQDFDPVTPYHPSNTFQQSNKMKEIDVKNDHASTARREMTNSIKRNDRSYTESDKSADVHHDYDDIVSRFAARHLQREQKKIGIEKASSLSSFDGDIISRVLSDSRMSSSNDGEEENEVEEQPNSTHIDDNLERPGAYPVGGLTYVSDTSSEESQYQQPQTFVAADLAPNIDAIQQENDELRRQIQQEREQPIEAQSARIIRTWICGFSRKQLLIVANLLLTAVVAFMVASYLQDLMGNRNLRENSFMNLLLLIEPTLNVSQVKNSDAFQWIITDSYNVDGVHQENNTLHLLERYALAVLYYATNGTSWEDRYHFLSRGPHCYWNDGLGIQGVFCDVDGFVNKIDFVRGNLVGSMPSEIGLFSKATHLLLRNNDLTGTIPLEIGRLTSLKHLSLSSNSLYGTIPTEIGQLTNLIFLFLDGNSLSGTIQTDIVLLTNLEYVYISSNSLSGPIPSEIGLIQNLYSLKSYNNSLSGTIPSDIGLLSNLGHLSLAANYLSGIIPTEIGVLTNLMLFYLEENSLTGPIPSEIGLLTNLRDLFFHNNSLVGTIPSEIGLLLTNLGSLWLHENDLTGDVNTLFCDGNYKEIRFKIDCDKINCICCCTNVI